MAGGIVRWIRRLSSSTSKNCTTNGAEYSSGRYVEYLYHARPSLVSHYKAIDPGNVFKSGIGRTTKCADLMTGGEIARRDLRCDG